MLLQRIIRLCCEFSKALNFWEISKNSILLLKSKRFHHVMITALLKYLLSAFTCIDNILPNGVVRKKSSHAASL